MKEEIIYLDYNATSPISKEVAEAMRPFLDNYFGNPSSIHKYGTEAKKAVEKARRQVASLINCEPSEIVFTSGGTESNNYAIKGIAYANKGRGNHIITSAIEHPAVFEVCNYLRNHGFEITTLPVDSLGFVAPEDIRKSIKPSTVLISIMHANNEVGSIQNIAEIGAIAKEHNVYFHTDAAQSVGKIPVDVQYMQVDLLSIAGHKLYAPKGIGALYIRDGLKLEKFMHGADHEQNLRAGTENVLEIVGLGEAAAQAQENLIEIQKQTKNTRDLLLKLLKLKLPELQVNSDPERCLPNTLSVSFPNIEANTLVSRLETVAVSAGAACHSESIDVSAVLQAMQVPLEYAMGTIRLSTGKYTTLEEAERAAEAITATVKELRFKDGDVPAPARNIKNIKLTHFTRGLGCACKLEQKKLDRILKKLKPIAHPNVLVGTESSDDAAVYKISEEHALVQTIDFFTPVVDDPYDFGAIAAANALSDIYAMGAKPVFALNIVGFPEETLPMEVLEQILLGAQDKTHEAGIPILGGHSVEDPEPKFGLVVSGLVDPKKVIKNQGAMPGDVLVLTKPLGTGIITTAIKRGLVEPDLEKEVVTVMSTLNKKAAEIMLQFGPHACTDITGFGLLGHLAEMLRNTEVSAELEMNKIPFIREVKNLAAAGTIPGGSYNNLEFVSEEVSFNGLSKINQLLLADAQTSGGLLIALNPVDAATFIDRFNAESNIKACVIGKILRKQGYLIDVR